MFYSSEREKNHFGTENHFAVSNKFRKYSFITHGNQNEMLNKKLEIASSLEHEKYFHG